MSIEIIVAIAHLCFSVGSGDGLGSIASPYQAHRQILACQQYYVACVGVGPITKSLAKCVLEKP